MAVNYTWAIVQLDCYPEADGEADVVFNAHWTLAGRDGVHAADVYGSQAVTLNPSTPFTPYAMLTEAQVVSWVKAVMGPEQVALYEADIASRIAAQVNPPVVTPPLPWAN